jgi:hypothetical protein
MLSLEYYLSDFLVSLVVKKQFCIELNLEDIQNDYAGNLLTHL